MFFGVDKMAEVMIKWEESNEWNVFFQDKSNDKEGNNKLLPEEVVSRTNLILLEEAVHSKEEVTLQYLKYGKYIEEAVTINIIDHENKMLVYTDNVFGFKSELPVNKIINIK